LCLSQIFSQFGRPTFWTDFGHKIRHFSHFEPKNKHKNAQNRHKKLFN